MIRYRFGSEGWGKERGKHENAANLPLRECFVPKFSSAPQTQWHSHGVVRLLEAPDHADPHVMVLPSHGVLRLAGTSRGSTASASLEPT